MAAPAEKARAEAVKVDLVKVEWAKVEWAKAEWAKAEWAKAADRRRPARVPAAESMSSCIARVCSVRHPKCAATMRKMVRSLIATRTRIAALASQFFLAMAHPIALAPFVVRRA